MENLLALYKEWSGAAPLKAETLPKAGSNRRYVRLHGRCGKTVIGVVGTSVSENHSFVYLASHFTSKGLPMPRILAINDDETCYLQEDLGRISLYDALAPARQNDYHYGEAETALLARTLRLLPHIQVRGSEGLDYSQCLPPVRFDAQAAMFDLNYFKYSFLKTTDLPFDELQLEADLQRFAADLAGDATEEHFFLYRDCQARNVMLLPQGGPRFIDFQGGMEGPLQYDVASFLWQASARYPQTLREYLVGQYLDELHKLLPTLNEERFRQRLALFVLFRTLQVLGAYGLRGYVERKKYFLDSIPLAIRSLRRLLLDGVAHDYPCLDDVLRRMVRLPRFDDAPRTAAGPATKGDEAKAPLVVKVFSFSYKKGIPADDSGNGGGYVFDCRSTHNPGRYEPYKQLTGLDEPVIRFLEDDGEILTFLDSVYHLADIHTARYLERGFTSLMFCFGCTGGQHRSVYSAQHLAEHLNGKYGVEVRLCHREQGIEQVLAAKAPHK